MGLPLEPLTHLECQLYEDDASGQCPLQVVGGDWRAGTLKKKKCGFNGKYRGFPTWNQQGGRHRPQFLAVGPHESLF